MRVFVPSPCLTSFGYKPASRQKQFSFRAASYTSLRTFPRRHSIYYDFKKIYTDVPLELPKADQVLLLFTRFQRCSLTETGRWKEILFRKAKFEKRFVRPESRRSSVVWYAAFRPGGSRVRSPSFDRRLFRFSSSCSV